MRHACSVGLVLGIGIGLSASQTSLATPVAPEILDQIGPRLIDPGRSQKNMVNLCRDLFFYGTHGGNGRTRGTCEPPSNDFATAPDLIADLSDDDPFFADLAGLKDADVLKRSGTLKSGVETQICAQPKQEATP